MQMITIQYEESHFDGLCLQRTNLVPLVPDGICVKSYYYYSVQFVRKKALAALSGAVHMSRASPANRADSILSRPMVA